MRWAIKVDCLALVLELVGSWYLFTSLDRLAYQGRSSSACSRKAAETNVNVNVISRTALIRNRVNVNVNVISRTALIRNRVSRRVCT